MQVLYNQSQSKIHGCHEYLRLSVFAGLFYTLLQSFIRSFHRNNSFLNKISNACDVHMCVFEAPSEPSARVESLGTRLYKWH